MKNKRLNISFSNRITSYCSLITSLSLVCVLIHFLKNSEVPYFLSIALLYTSFNMFIFSTFSQVYIEDYFFHIQNIINKKRKIPIDEFADLKENNFFFLFFVPHYVLKFKNGEVYKFVMFPKYLVWDEGELDYRNLSREIEKLIMEKNRNFD